MLDPSQPHTNHPRKRPKNLNLLSVKFPMSAVMSVGHRAAGVFLFLTIPYLLYLLQLSLTSEAGFALAKAELQSPLAKIFWLIAIWALAHHFLAGIRYFLLDFDIAIKREMAQKSAVFVMIGGFVVAVICAVILF
ncbi:succinate dehydrogenase, cytochrome b556 subunit [sulfur-oxidizing endosymbiont of Gigantopelta aegis]|uniref:succinate dehydrogenase, cytochrome b556 subunit n=1 Tax=sulfur-oxidizing endosymbiont of Gigantopelta aegis TaxID=2794934 RepID=UPI0018DE8F45|nr:succinate dehydrogenase, cytochrome b556 subunit [sulfur-oxidizing endosymbiont of Gigantopelta aegis]